MLYLKTDDDIRYKRISITIEQAKEEKSIKEFLKDEVGIEKYVLRYKK